MLDIPDSGAYYVFDGDNIDSEMMRSFIGLFPWPPPSPLFDVSWFRCN